MLLLLIFWILLAWACTVYGWAGLRLFTTRPAAEQFGWEKTMLSGFLLLTVLASILSLLFPIGLGVQLGIVLVGVGLHRMYRGELAVLMAAVPQRLAGLPVPILLGTILLMATALWDGTSTVSNNDSIIYHSQAIEWIRQYAVVPGLGNLHGRFAFNSHFFIATALFSLPPFDQHILYPIGSFFFFLLTSSILWQGYKAFREKDSFRLVLNGILFFFLVLQSIGNLSSPSTDTISLLLTIYVFRLFLNMKRPLHPGELILLAGLVFTTITFKLSSVFVALLLPGLLLPLTWRKVGRFVAIGAVVLIPFLARNVILSGYLVYPFPSVDVFSLSWKIPKAQAEFEKDLVKGWARLAEKKGMPEPDAAQLANAPFSVWVGPWLSTYGLKWKVIFLVNILGVIPLFISLLRGDYHLTILFLTLLAGIVFWFLNGPDPRFAEGFLGFGFALAIAYPLSLIRPTAPIPGLAQWVFPLLLLVGIWSERQLLDPSGKNLSRLLLPAPYPNVKTELFEAKNFRMRISTNERFCGLSPLPCTPYPNPELAMRGETLQEGFWIAGQ